MKIKAAVCREWGAPLVIEELDLAEPREKEVLIKTVTSSICGTDMGCLRDGFNGLNKLPIVYGHEGCGVIEKVGPKVTEFKVGDTVVCCQPHCGECPECRQGRPWRCQEGLKLVQMGGFLDGVSPLSKNGECVSLFSGCSTFADHMVANVNTLTKVPDYVPASIGAPFGCGFITGVGTIVKALKPQSFNTIVFFGVGSIGCAALMAAKNANCRTIIAVDIVDSNLDMAKELGADYVFNYKDTPNVLEEIRALTNGGADFAVDTTTSGEMFPISLASVRKDGHAALIGLTGEVTLKSAFGTFSGRQFTTISMGFTYPQYEMEIMFDWYRRGMFPVEKIMTYYRLEDINQAIADVKSGACMKAMIKFD